MTSLTQLWDGLSQTHAALWAILAVCALLLWKYLRQKPMKTHYESDERPIAREILDLHDAWGNLAIFWGRLHVVLTVIAIVFAAFVASGDTLFGDQTLLRSMVAVSSAIATGLLATLHVPAHALQDDQGMERAKLEGVHSGLASQILGCATLPQS